MNRIHITEIKADEYRIDYKYEVQGEWKQYFTDENFFMEYSKEIEGVPKSIAVIPLLGTILPLAWLFDAEIILDEIDKDFYESIPKFKQGYIEMYPMLDFSGKVTAKDIVDNSKFIQAERNACMFSGGADAFQTLITHVEENPILLSVWGADVAVDNKEGWEVVRKHIELTAKENKLEAVVIRSSFRKIIDEGKLHRYVMRLANDGWWHGFHHGIGILTLAAPIAYRYGIKNLYIASSFTIEDKGKVTCASDPTIDNFVRFGKCQVVHDGYEFNRQQKIHRICEYSRQTGKGIPLRVCWKSVAGTNCCKCEKCYRTILAILAEKEDPRNYGFEYSKREFKKIIYDLKYNMDAEIWFNKKRCRSYFPIQEAMKKNYSLREVPFDLRWFYKMNVYAIEEMPFRRKNIIWKGIRFLERLFLER